MTGVVITFYSYKGGVGRSLAIANLASILHRRGKSVIVCDLDLEAPGLERYLVDGEEGDRRKEARVTELASHRGFVDLLEDFQQAVAADAPPPGTSLPTDQRRFRDVVVPRPGAYVQPLQEPNQELFGLLTAGSREDREAFVSKVQQLDWNDVYARWSGAAFVDLVREELTSMADFVLVDARTGITELGGIATHYLADAVVLMTNATHASRRGLRDVALSLGSDDVLARRGDRELHLLPLSSRIDLQAETDDLGHFQHAFRGEFRGYVSEWVLQSDLSVDDYLRGAEICYIAKFSFGERVVARVPASQRHELLHSRYDWFADRLHAFHRRFRAEFESARMAGSEHVFVSYRQADSKGWVERIRAELGDLVGQGSLFADSDIQPGDAWPTRLREALEQAAAVIVVIGPNWLRQWDDAGRRLLDLEDDWCRMEIETALVDGKPLLPVLVDGARMPAAHHLPRSIAELAEVQAFTLDPNDVDTGIAALARALERWVTPTESGSSRDGPPRVWHAYRSYLREAHGRLMSFFPEADQRSLAEVYVPLALLTENRKEPAAAAPPDGAPSRERVGRTALDGSGRASLEEMLALPPDGDVVTGAWVVLGEPGAGKTTLARHLACSLASPERAESVVPVYVPLAALVGTNGRHPFDLAQDALERARGQAAAAGLSERLTEIASASAAGDGDRPRQVWLLLDGLDEVAPEHHDEARRLLGELPRQFEHVRIAVFSRAIGYRSLGEPYRTARLQPLDGARRLDLLGNWLGTARARSLHARLMENDELHRLASNPLLLTLIARLAEPRADLPADRVELFEQSVQLLLRTPYDPNKEPLQAPADAEWVLSGLALELQGSENASWSRDELHEALWRVRNSDNRSASILTTTWNGDHERFLDEIAHRTGLLAPDQAGVWTFAHRQFREFLAAQGLRDREVSTGWKTIVGELDAAAISRWQETLGLYCAMTRTDHAEEVIDAFAEYPGAAVKALGDVDGVPVEELFDRLWRIPSEIDGWTWGPEQQSRFHWDGDALLRVLRVWLNRGRWTREAAIEALWRRVVPEAAVHELAWVHYTLSALSDVSIADWRGRFFGACGRDAAPMEGPEFVTIAGGTFWMGSPADEAERYDYEGPRHEVAVSAFDLARTAVTNRQYREFDPAHEPREWPGVSAEELLDHPVVNVGWWETYLYCAWRGWRLPSEAEWEYACRAGTGTPFSFGANVTPELVNYDGNLPYAGGAKGKDRERTVAVGSLPANPWGLHEMHGNVWEWCADRWHDDYEEAPSDGSAWTDSDDDARVLRGGSWIYYAGACRSACRFRFAPGLRSDFVGFRPARSCH